MLSASPLLTLQKTLLYHITMKLLHSSTSRSQTPFDLLRLGLKCGLLYCTVWDSHLLIDEYATSCSAKSKSDQGRTQYLILILSSGIATINNDVCASCVSRSITSKIYISSFELGRLAITAHWNHAVPQVLSFLVNEV
jgi:hypothetical protein